MLLDWGICEYLLSGNERAEIAGRRLAALLKICSPSTVVLKTERWESAIASPSGRALIEAITRETSARSIPICLIRQNQLRRTFLNLQCETKEEIASALARIFPELLWKLPPKRQIWQSEHPRMTMFDAIALGLAYWQHSSTQLPPPSEG
jgi:hypothetical protein